MLLEASSASGISEDLQMCVASGAQAGLCTSCVVFSSCSAPLPLCVNPPHQDCLRDGEAAVVAFHVVLYNCLFASLGVAAPHLQILK